METPDLAALNLRIARLEDVCARQKAEIAVHRGALVWLMGVHQLSFEDANPRRAVLDPLGLSLDYARADAGGGAQSDPQQVTAARDFIEAAYSVFLSRQPPAS